MTLDAVLVQARVKELRALTRVRQAIVETATDPAWTYALAALDARLYELRALLSHDDPELVRRGDETPADYVTSQSSLPALPAGARVH